MGADGTRCVVAANQAGFAGRQGRSRKARGLSGPTRLNRRGRMSGYILAIDQGTTSSRAIVFGPDRTIAGSGQKEFTQHFPQDGWVEHDPEEIWDSVVWAIRKAIKDARIEAK